jgi:hypothetical protein
MDATNDTDLSTAAPPLPNLAALPRHGRYGGPATPSPAVVEAELARLLPRVWRGEGRAMHQACALLVTWEPARHVDPLRPHLADAIDRLEVAVREAPTTDLRGLACKAWLLREYLRDTEGVGADASATPTLVQGLFALVEAEEAGERRHV